jgi:hypothetical protein
MIRGFVLAAVVAEKDEHDKQLELCVVGLSLVAM